MPITIKKEATVRLARALKQQTGKAMTRIIHEALEEKWQRQSQAEPDPDLLLAKLRAISHQVAIAPELDARSNDDIVGYDANGLPS